MSTINYESKLAAIKTTWEAATATYEHERDKLLQPDGKPLYAPSVQSERQAALTATVRGAGDRARSEANAVVSTVESSMLAQSVDPLLQLSKADEREEVSYKTPIIADNVKIASLPQLTDQLRAITVHGSKVEKLLFVRYAGYRLEAEKQRIYDGKEVPGILEVRQAFEALAAATGTGNSIDAKTLEAAKREAHKLVIDINSREMALGVTQERQLDYRSTF